MPTTDSATIITAVCFTCFGKQTNNIRTRDSKEKIIHNSDTL
jgi:hypothetical protein